MNGCVHRFQQSEDIKEKYSELCFKNLQYHWLIGVIIKTDN